MQQRYKVKRHAGQRTRPMVAVTLAKDELALLDALAKRRGLSRSALVGQLIRAAK
jgi:Ribbon-helix-helix protein, copG family